jgi:hypothetical protein
MRWMELFASTSTTRGLRPPPSYGKVGLRSARRRGTRAMGKRARSASGRVKSAVCSSSRLDRHFADTAARDIMGSREKVELTVWGVPGLAAGV